MNWEFKSWINCNIDWGAKEKSCFENQQGMDHQKNFQIDQAKPDFEVERPIMESKGLKNCLEDEEWLEMKS